MASDWLPTHVHLQPIRSQVRSLTQLLTLTKTQKFPPQSALKLGQSLLQKGAGELPNMHHVRVVHRLAWAAAAGDLSLHQAAPEDLRSAILAVENLSPELIALAREAMEVIIVN